MFRWIQSIFSKPDPAKPMVRYYDVSTKRVVQIPAAELRPGCVQARIQGLDGIVWISADQVHQGPLRHPPFDEDIRQYIRQIQEAFAEQRPLSFDEWEEGFRRDGDPIREIAGFSYTADVYSLFTKDEPSAERRREVYRLLIGCMTTSRESVWHVVPRSTLSRTEAEQIVHRFYGGEKAGPAQK